MENLESVTTLPQDGTLQTIAQKSGVNADLAANSSNEWVNTANVLSQMYESCEKANNFQIEIALIGVSVCVKNDNFDALKAKNKAKIVKGLKVFSGTMQEQGKEEYMESLYLMPKLETKLEGKDVSFFALATFKNFVNAINAPSYNGTFEISKGDPYKGRETFNLKEI